MSTLTCAKTTASGRPREYHIKGFGFALQIWAFEVFLALAALHFVVHEENGHIPHILQWRSNTSTRFHELMSQVDVQLLRPSVIDKQQPYWTWGDSVDNNEEIVELFVDEAEEKTSISVEQKDDEFDEAVILPSFSKVSMTRPSPNLLGNRDGPRLNSDITLMPSPHTKD
ncbi:unnamed protein product [Prunus armeniaca]